MSVCLSGRVEEFNLPQVIALLEAVQASGHLEVRGAEGAGCLDFRRGNVVGAHTAGCTGELAAYTVLAWSDGEFQFARNGSEPTGSLGRSNQALCLEAMRLLDESRNPAASFTPAGRHAGASLPSPQAEITAALAAGHSTITEIASACRLPLLETFFHLECLERAGAAARTAKELSGADSQETRSDTIRVLVVDDSELMRRALTRLFESDPGIKVVGTASNGHDALVLLPTARPDVISLDLHMPGMDGVTTLKNIMLRDPTPTVIMTASSPDALDLTFDAILRFGAVDFIAKPSRTRGEIGEQERYILQRLRHAAEVNLLGVRLFQPRLAIAPRRAVPGDCDALMVAVAGTGACLSLMQVLSHLPADLPFGLLGYLPLQEEFLRAFVVYMNRFAPFEVRLAEDGASLASGVCILTNGGAPLRIAREQGKPLLRSRAVDGPCDPNLLFYDASQVFGERTVGLVLSGEALDLAGGLAAVRSCGGIVLAQLPDTCAHSAGPAEVLQLGLADKAIVLNRLSAELMQFIIDRRHRARASSGPTAGESDKWPRRSV